MKPHSAGIQVNHVPIVFERITHLPAHLGAERFSSIHILTDTNTSVFCMPLLRDLDWPGPIQEISIPAGEAAKTLDTCHYVWRTLVAQGADRQSILINLGGGVVTDLGGFCAATYMRGMAFAHVTTSVMGMADAAIGGKHGVDLDTLKNYVGLFVSPELVWVDTQFLKTLPDRQVRNGVAEIIKHGCIGDPTLLDAFTNAKWDRVDWSTVLMKSLGVKKQFVENDPQERSQRAALNFGHTIGHALETFGLQKDLDLLHGEAVALGMRVEAEISARKTGLPKSQYDKVHQRILEIFPDVRMPQITRDRLELLIGRDKKRQAGHVHFVLLSTLGAPLIRQTVPFELIWEVLSMD